MASISIEHVNQSSEELIEALARLYPQLSPNVAIPTEDQLFKFLSWPGWIEPTRYVFRVLPQPLF